MGIRSYAKKIYANYVFKKKYKGYCPASDGHDMQFFIDWINEWSTLNVKNVFEIGANFAQDAEYLAHGFNVNDEDVFVFEAHPELYNSIKRIHNFNAYNYAVFNENKEIIFNILPLNEKNTGLSSILSIKKGNTVPVKVNAIRMDYFMEVNGIEKIDFLKLDVEGVNWEVLDGFGNRLKDVNCIHVESEHTKIFKENNHLFSDIRDILKKNDFELIFFLRNKEQSDSFWIQKKYLSF